MASKITDNLYLGTYKDALNLTFLQDHDITHIVNASKERNFYPHRIKYRSIYIDDTPESDISAYFEPTSKFIDKAICASGNVLVHCMAGISRSSTLVVAYLVSKKSMTLDAALELVREKRPIVEPNSGFMEQLKKNFC